MRQGRTSVQDFRGEAFDMRSHGVTIAKHTKKPCAQFLRLAFFVKLGLSNLISLWLQRTNDLKSWYFKTLHMRGKRPSNRNAVDETRIKPKVTHIYVILSKLKAICRPRPLTRLETKKNALCNPRQKDRGKHCLKLPKGVWKPRSLQMLVSICAFVYIFFLYG